MKMQVLGVRVFAVTATRITAIDYQVLALSVSASRLTVAIAGRIAIIALCPNLIWQLGFDPLSNDFNICGGQHLAKFCQHEDVRR